jgi:hypothetical protein
MGSDKKDKSYGIEPEGDAKGDAEAGDALEPEPEAIQALDVCPNCSSPLGGVDVVVCLRCGFDMKALKVIETDTKGTARPAESDEEKGVLSGPGLGDLWLPLAMAGIGLGLLLVGYLFGSSALFGGDEAVGFGDRAMGLLKMLVKTAVLTLAGFGGLYALAQMVNKQVGDAQLALARVLGIMGAAGLLTFFNIENAVVEWTIEAVTQALAFLGLSMVLFRLSIRDAATLLGVTVMAVVILLLVSALVLWAVVPSY